MLTSKQQSDARILGCYLRNALSQIPDLTVPEPYAKKRAEEVSAAEFIFLTNA